MTLKDKIHDRISKLDQATFTRRDIQGEEGYDQVGRALRQLISSGVISRIGTGLYAKNNSGLSKSALAKQARAMLEHSSKTGRISRQIYAIEDNTKTTRLSDQLQLSFPYDWSNSSMDPTLLMIKVAESARFKDLAILCKHYGIDTVSNTLESHFDQLPINTARQLRNIAIGFSL